MPFRLAKIDPLVQEKQFKSQFVGKSMSKFEGKILVLKKFGDMLQDHRANRVAMGAKPKPKGGRKCYVLSDEVYDSISSFLTEYFSGMSADNQERFGFVRPRSGSSLQAAFFIAFRHGIVHLEYGKTVEKLYKEFDEACGKDLDMAELAMKFIKRLAPRRENLPEELFWLLKEEEFNKTGTAWSAHACLQDLTVDPTEQKILFLNAFGNMLKLVQDKPKRDVSGYIENRVNEKADINLLKGNTHSDLVKALNTKDLKMASLPNAPAFELYINYRNINNHFSKIVIDGQSVEFRTQNDVHNYFLRLFTTGSSDPNPEYMLELAYDCCHRRWFDYGDLPFFLRLTLNQKLYHNYDLLYANCKCSLQ